MQEYDYTLRLIGDNNFTIQLEGSWDSAIETAKYYAQYCKVISFYDRNQVEIITLTCDQLLNEMLTVIHEQ